MSKTGLAALGVVMLAAGMLILVTTISRQGRETSGRPSFGSLPELDETWKNTSILSEYRLLDQTGKLFDSRSLIGQVHVVSFFFAKCPGPCHFQNKAVENLQEKYGPQGVKFISITCDPEQDTVESLFEYAAKYNARPEQWRFLTGDLLHIRRIGAEIYQAAVDKGTHVERLIAVDRAGKIRGAYDWKSSQKMGELRHELELMLLEKAPGSDTASATSSSAQSPLE